MTKLVLDSNLLVLFVVGATDRELIAKHRRLQAYSPGDYDTLVGVMERATEVVVSPNTLTETSNLIRYIQEPACSAVCATFERIITSTREIYIESTVGAKRSEFNRLGLTDSVLLHMNSAAVLLTADLDLYMAALKSGYEAINFNHLRAQALGI